jgi:hypothetical protein
MLLDSFFPSRDADLRLNAHTTHAYTYVLKYSIPFYDRPHYRKFVVVPEACTWVDVAHLHMHPYTHFINVITFLLIQFH